jgi:hypothetical protein
MSSQSPSQRQRDLLPSADAGLNPCPTKSPCAKERLTAMERAASGQIRLTYPDGQDRPTDPIRSGETRSAQYAGDGTGTQDRRAANGVAVDDLGFTFAMVDRVVIDNYGWEVS